MTVNELIKELQELKAHGMGNHPILVAYGEKGNTLDYSVVDELIVTSRPQYCIGVKEGEEVVILS